MTNLGFARIAVVIGIGIALAALVVLAAPSAVVNAGVASTGADPRGWIWIADYNYQRTDLTPRYQVVDFDGRHTSEERLPKPGPLSPDGRRIAWAVRDTHGLRVMQANYRPGEVKGEAQQLFSVELPPRGMRLDSYVSALAWAPQGTYLAFSIRDTRAGDTYLHRLADRQGKVWEIECSAGDEGQWSMDGTRYACGLKNGKVVIFDPAAGGRAERFSAPDPTDFFNDIHWSPDGSAIAFFHGHMAKGPEGGPPRRSLETIDVKTGKNTVLISDVDAVVGEKWTPSQLQWSPNGKLISFASREQLFVFNVQTRDVRKAVTAAQIDRAGENEIALMDCPRWSLDSTALAFQIHVGERFTKESVIRNRALFAYDLGSKKVRKLIDEPAGWCLDVSPRAPPTTRILQ